MKRKAVAAVLTAVMVASMFTGCGSDNGSSSAKSASAASAASAANDTVDEDGKVNGIMYQEGLPLVDEGDYTFSIFCDDSSESGEFIMLDEFKKQTNVDVDLKIYPYETAIMQSSPMVSTRAYSFRWKIILRNTARTFLLSWICRV